jgi:patatin-like phospholipase/acyl hydrolase
MLTTAVRDHSSRVGLALAGGAPEGAIYEIGVIRALDEALDGIDFNELDVYVGVSSGGFVVASLANGISPSQMYRLFIDDGVDATMTPQLFLRPAFGEFYRRLVSLPALSLRAGLRYLRDPLDADTDLPGSNLMMVTR